MRQSIIIYPTSADPPTIGHADVLKRASLQFDLVYWLIGNNPYKKPFFKINDRLAMMDKYVQKLKLKNVMIDKYNGAVVRFAHKKGARFLLRGLRNSTDFQMEIALASGNRGIDETIETICIFSNPKYSTISSSLVRELAILKESYSQYVIPEVERIIRKII